jgi:hypothetical protein
MTVEQEFEFTYEVLEIIADDDAGSNGAKVCYTPHDDEPEQCSIVTKFVPIPFHKARDKEHAIELLEKKINSYAPRSDWMKEVLGDPSGDTKTIGAEIAESLGVTHEPSVKQRRSASSAAVPESSGHEGSGGTADGDAPDEAGADSEGRGDAGATETAEPGAG